MMIALGYQGGVNMNQFFGFILRLGEDVYQAKQEQVNTLFGKYANPTHRHPDIDPTAKSNPH